MAKRKITPQTRQKMRRASQKNWRNPSYYRKTLQKALEQREDLPNSEERLLLSYLEQIQPGYWKYVGDGQFFISRMNPDFVNIRDKRIIEYNGCYWHACPICFPKAKSQVKKMDTRINIFKSYGYETVVVWSHDLKAGVQRIIQKISTTV